jgi:acyl-CoA synthetase (AMP-forming)/AMP-acid ligase II
MKADELFVVGRIKNTIIIYGNKHSAEDLETAVMSSHELFTGFAGAAFGVDADGQEQAVIVQEVKHRENCSDELTAAAARAFASVAREYGLRLFDIVLVRAGTLPRTANGKIKRAQARQKYLEGGFKRLNPHGRESQAGGYHFLNERLV